jgi:uncharacterized membrane protein YhaH (DUF805 family)
MKWFLIVLRHYADFSGRARRKEFWMFELFYALFALVVIGIDAAIGTVRIFHSLYVLAMLLPSFAVTVRRLHDTGRSGWWTLLTIVPALIILPLTLARIIDGHGNEPLIAVLSLMLMAGSIWLFILTLLEGQYGSNSYGSDPKNMSPSNDDGRLQEPEYYPPGYNYALLHIYRRSAVMGFGISYNLHLGNEVIFRVKNGSRTTVKVTGGGQYVLWGKTERKVQIPIHIQLGREYYIRCGLKIGILAGVPKMEIVDSQTGKPEYDAISPAQDSQRTVKANSGEATLIAAATNGDAALAEQLLARGADVNAADENGYTALMFAALTGHTETVRFLLARGANANATDNSGFTALIFAAVKGYSGIVKMLLARGANASAADKDGHTPLWYATKQGHAETVKALQEWEKIRDTKNASVAGNESRTATVRNNPEGLLEKLQKVRVCTPAKDIIAMFGSPDFENPAEAIFSNLGFVPASEKGKTYWQYNSPHGSWQVAVKNGEAVATTGIDAIIEKLQAERPPAKKDREEKVPAEPVYFSIRSFTPVVTVPGFTKEAAYSILNAYLEKNKPQNMNAGETELLKPFFLNLLMHFRHAAVQYAASGRRFGGICDACNGDISIDRFYLMGNNYGKCQDCALESIVSTLDWNYYLGNVILAIGQVPREIISQAYSIRDRINERRKARK